VTTKLKSTRGTKISSIVVVHFLIDKISILLITGAAKGKNATGKEKGHAAQKGNGGAKCPRVATRSLDASPRAAIGNSRRRI
jgi:hypothetical protein